MKLFIDGKESGIVKNLVLPDFSETKFPYFGARRNGRSSLYDLLNNPKNYKRIKNRKLRRRLYHHFAKAKKGARINITAKWLESPQKIADSLWDKYKDKLMDEESFKKEYLCTWDFGNDQDHSIKTIRTRSGFKFYR